MISKHRSVLPAAALLLAISATGNANPTPQQEVQRADRFEARIYKTTRGPEIPFRLLVPWNYDRLQSWPLVIMLHGSGERGTDNKAQLKNDGSVLASDENREKFPSFVLVPQCPDKFSWSSIKFANGGIQVLPEESPVEANLLKVIADIRKEFNIDSKRLYITGLSLGGFGTWDILSRYPDMFAAAAPVCGGGDPTKAVRFAKVPIWAWHGEVDGTVNLEMSKKMIEALKAAGGDPKLTIVPNVGHDSWWTAYESPELWDWMFKQIKK